MNLAQASRQQVITVRVGVDDRSFKMKLLSFYAGLCVYLLCISSATSVLAADKYTVCIGDICQGGVKGAASYIYGCGFARANSSNTDQAAAKQVCLFENSSKNYTSYDYQRYDAGPGGACGVLFVLVICR